jgi:fumarate reductase flavoprotein subunit
VVQQQQGITAIKPEELWEKNKEAYAKRFAIPELFRIVLVNGARCVDIWTQEFGVEWMRMDPKAYTNFFHIAAPGMQNDHRLLEPLVGFAKDNGAEFLFETKAISLIVDKENAVVGVRVQDQVTGKFQDIKAKKTLVATGDWVSNQEMVAKYLPKWEGVPMTTYTSMGDGVQMGAAVGANLVRMEEPSNLMAHYAPTVVWGYYNSIIHVSPEGKRLGNENNIHAAADYGKEAGFLFWWTICDDTLANGVHAESFRTREKAGGVVKADTIEELAAKTRTPFEQLKTTMDKYNEDAKAGTDTEFKKATAFTPINPPYYAVPSTIVRYKTNGGLDINANCEVVDRGKTPIKNLYAAGSCQGQTTPNVNDVCAIGMHAGQQMAASLKQA